MSQWIDGARDDVEFARRSLENDEPLARQHRRRYLSRRSSTGSTSSLSSTSTIGGAAAPVARSFEICPLCLQSVFVGDALAHVDGCVPVPYVNEDPPPAYSPASLSDDVRAVVNAVRAADVAADDTSEALVAGDISGFLAQQADYWRRLEILRRDGVLSGALTSDADCQPRRRAPESIDESRRPARLQRTSGNIDRMLANFKLLVGAKTSLQPAEADESEPPQLIDALV